MAWHILHGLLEQVRLQSTFPGKVWIVTMFIFRIVVVARIGDNVYHDEQSSFVCNTLTPGCENVCFNRFSPISQLRFWSLMVLVVASPSIFFFLYAMHTIYHAGVKFPYKEQKKQEERSQTFSHTKFDSVYLPSPSHKRRKESENLPNGHAGSPLYVVTKIRKNGESSRWRKFLRKRRHPSHDNDVTTDPIKRSVSDNNENDLFFDSSRKYPIYTDSHYRHIEFVKEEKVSPPEKELVQERKFKMKMLQHPELSRAYWWHVLLRTLCEVAFLLAQYYLYGISVPELYECPYWPCPKTVDCFVSRPQEKTCLLWLMYGLGVIACILSLFEFWALGVSRVKNAFICCTNEETYEERKKRLAMLDIPKPTKSPRGGRGSHGHRLTRGLSMESISSDTTVESV